MATLPPRLLRALESFNSAHPWSHNAHYHPWLLRQLPCGFGRALDVGCGSGDLVRLLAARSSGGFALLMRQFALERLVVAMGAVAEAGAALRETTAHTKQRTAFGRPLARFQDTRFRLAAMRARISSAQAFVDTCVLAHNQGTLTADQAAEAKLVTTEPQGEVVDDCLQMFGGSGYLWDSPICRRYADARVQRIYGGTSEIMK